MADIRIKDLTTLESASLTGDVFVIDGTTGTRKLSAFSPTFGGNATVTGTLTVNGVATASAGISIGDGTFGAGKIYTSATGGLSLGAKTGSSYDFILADPSGNLIAYVPTGTTRMVLSSTTASTTTSTGALVVGNGTSGGLGVGGAANIGGTLTVSNPVVAQGTAITGYQFLAKDTGGTAVGAAYALQTSGGTDKWRWGLRGSAGSLTDSLIFSYLSGSWSDALTLSNAGVVSIPATTASTSTSSGALVVSGGVGVAGAGNFGGAVGVGGATVASRLHVYESTSGTGDSNGITIEQASTADAALQFLLTGVQRWTVGIDNSDSDKFKIGTGAIGSADRLTIDTSGNLVAGGSVQTAAPSGGTAAAWKLGTVATVSPTSPNRTIEVDIGGTIYYIHAKTTNN